MGKAGLTTLALLSDHCEKISVVLTASPPSKLFPGYVLVLIQEETETAVTCDPRAATSRRGPASVAASSEAEMTANCDIILRHSCCEGRPDRLIAVHIGKITQSLRLNEE
ncbi:hypothetical protein J6590_010687 [Homalodisca vitripennis]|nr:hypothetical protein J6590_010687 [Homalodisca vitripennis]